MKVTYRVIVLVAINVLECEGEAHLLDRKDLLEEPLIYGFH
jgi:hypothetical protein